MILYLFQSISILFIIISISNFLKNKLKIENNIKYLLTVLILITLCFFLLNIISFINIKTNFVLNYLIIYKYLLFILIIISALIFKLSKKKFDNLDISFIVLYFFICFFCYDRYFLDEDEFTYWGQRIKDIYYYIDTQNFKIQTYHQPFLTSWQILFTVILGFEENIIIFANNIIIISGFFYLVGNFCNKENINYFSYLLFYFIYLLII